MLRAGFNENLGRSAPNDDDAVALVARLEVADVLSQLFGEIPLRFPLLYVGAVDAGDVFVVEHGGHRLDRAQKIGDWVDVAVLEYAGFFRGRQRIIRNWIPGAEYDVVQLCQRNELLDQRRALVRSLAEADSRHLG